MKKLLMAATLVVATNVAVAEDFGFYMYGNAGVARISIDDQSELDADVRSAPGVSQMSSSVEDNPTAFKLQLGYQFDTNWAIEGGYTHVEDLKYSAIARIGGASLGASLHDKISAWNVVAALTLPLGASRFEGTGRVGVARVREEGGFTFAGVSIVDVEESKTGLTYGVGLKYNLNPNFSVRADLDHYEAKNDDFNVWSVGAGYKF